MTREALRRNGLEQLAQVAQVSFEVQGRMRLLEGWAAQHAHYGRVHSCMGDADFAYATYATCAALASQGLQRNWHV
nr:glutamate dehydrogenase [Aureimonas sp. AU4]